MVDYTLYYWPVPFRGQFVRAMLAFAGKSWDEQEPQAIQALMDELPAKQHVPFMGPPVLVDLRTGFALSQMPAIVGYLGDTLGLCPSTAEQRALCAKIVNDANDVIDELTLDGGQLMWTNRRWQAFVPRLQRWMLIWESGLERQKVRMNTGFVFGGSQPSTADLVTSTLWSTMADRFPVLGELLRQTAPRTARLSERVQRIPSLASLRRETGTRYGGTYCGGRIEQSLRAVLAPTGQAKRS
ncbi:glutathione S-transferase [Pseudorhodoferax sp.]|uniref:glutathione S-transferase n=1 Tax=Pseudorhodoferax sp. TaxID=1993553 RepID=UPI002DD69DD4|nr:glutathione S-transferase [Pseudorhodoferax sp.]